MLVYLLFGLAALLLLGLVALIWRLWRDYTQVGPDDEEHDREIAALNDAQANRISDTDLTRPIDADDAWKTMVQRGGAPRRRRQRKR